MNSENRLEGLSITLPAYNEEDNVVRAVEEALRAGERFAKECEVVVVDDGSRDATARLVDELGAADPRVRLVRHGKNRGYGGAVRSGFEAARMPFVFLTDADLQFDLDDLEAFVPMAREHDMVLGYRASRSDPRIRRLNAWAWGKLQAVAFGLRVRDIDCAFKLLRREIFDAIDPLEAEGAFVSAELLIKAFAAGYRAAELPVRHYERREGQPTGANTRVILRAFREMARLWSRLPRVPRR